MMNALNGVRSCGHYRLWFVAVATAVTVLMGSVSVNAFADGSTVTICHIPPGDPDNKFSIEVSPAAAQAHYGHGDTQGECAGGGSGLGGGSGSGTTTAVPFSFILCDGREEESGRSLDINITGRGDVGSYDCL